jgi:hypothetical protein
MQEQRYNERMIRSWKSREVVAITPEDKIQAQQKIRFWQAKQRKLVEDYGFKRKYYREGIRIGHADKATSPVFTELSKRPIKPPIVKEPAPFIFSDITDKSKLLEFDAATSKIHSGVPRDIIKASLKYGMDYSDGIVRVVTKDDRLVGAMGYREKASDFMVYSMGTTGDKSSVELLKSIAKDASAADKPLYLKSHPDMVDFYEKLGMKFQKGYPDGYALLKFDTDEVKAFIAADKTAVKASKAASKATSTASKAASTSAAKAAGGAAKAASKPIYKVDPDTLATLKNLKARQSEYMGKKRVNSASSKYKAAKEYMEEAISNGDLRMRIPDEDILKQIMDSHFKNQFETGTSHGALNHGMRKEVSGKLFGTEYRNLDKVEFEKYGYLGNKNILDDVKADDASQYGGVIVQFKRDNLFNRTTFTMDDSLGPGLRDKLVASKLDDVVPVNLDTSWNTLDDFADDTKLKDLKRNGNPINPSDILKASGGSYVELQFHGDVTFDDVEMVVNTRRTQFSASTVKRLKDKGIVVKYMENGYLKEY